MKKISIVLITFCIFMLGIIDAKAMTLKPSGDLVGKQGDLIKIYLTLDRNEDDKDVSAVDGIISYDEDVMSYVTSTVLLDKWTEFMLINNNKMFSYANLSYDNLIDSSSQNIIEIIFKINNDAPFGYTDILLNNVSATDENGEGLEINGLSHKVKILSNINTLSSIQINGEDINFNKNTIKYNLTIDNDNVKINAVKEDSNSILEGDLGNKVLDYGINTFKIVVISEIGTKRTYTLNIERPDNRSKENRLNSLELSSGKINFDKDVLDYNIEVGNDISSISITASLIDDKSSFVSEYDSRTVNLNVGENKILIKIKAENGDVKVYTLNITRSEKENPVDNEVNNNNKTGNIWLIPIIILLLLSLGVLIYVIIIRKRKQ